MPPEQTVPLEKQTELTLHNHLKAFGTGDVDVIMTDYADEAVFITPEGVLHGKREIRPLFEGLVEDFPPGTAIDVKQEHIDGEMAYLVWTAESEKYHVPFATDTLIVRDGEIVRQTFAAQIEEKRTEQPTAVAWYAENRN